MPLYQWIFSRFGGPNAPNVPDTSGLPSTHVFYGFSGKNDRADGFDIWCRCVGSLLGFNIITVMADIINDIDLADDISWNMHLKELGPRGKFCASLWTPPCSTFTRVRSDTDGGPRVLRGNDGPELLGLPDLTPPEKEQVRLGTLLASRSGEGISMQSLAGRPWLIENPPEEVDNPSLFRVPPVASATGGNNVRRHVMPQCPFGSLSMKPTEFRSSFEFIDPGPQSCPHPRRWWRLPPSGRWIRSQHPVLKDKFCAVTPAQWDAMSQDERTKPAPEFITRAAAAYPSMLNCFLACQLIPQACAAAVSTSLVRQGRWNNVLACPGFFRTQQPVRPVQAGAGGSKRSAVDATTIAVTKRKPVMCTPLRMQAADVRAAEDLRAIGGMRRPHQSVAKLPSVAKFGTQLRGLLDRFLADSPDLQGSILESIGSDVPSPGPSEARLEPLRARLAEFLGVSDWAPVADGDFSTCIRAGLLAGWQKMAGDPDCAVPCWLQSAGVPAGLRMQPEDCHIFPRTSLQANSPEDLETDFSTHTPYASVESDDMAWEEILGMVQKRWLRRFDTLEEVTCYLGEAPVLSKFGMLTKVRGGRVKRRLILDGKVSGVSAVASKLERILLPKLLDVAVDVMDIATANAHAPDDEDAEFLVLDFQDAFWHMPLSLSERKWFVARLRNQYFVYLRNAQGSRNAPGGWGRIAALLGRMTQSLFCRTGARIEIYTDDPCMTVWGTKAVRDRTFAISILLWSLLGFPLSWRKGARGSSISWIGGQFSLKPGGAGVTVRIVQEIFDDSMKLVEDMLGSNVIPLRTLSTAVGKLAHISNLLTVWRPFMASLYAALHGPPPENCPPGCIWRRQVETALKWFRSFFALSRGFVERDFDTKCFLAVEVSLEIVLDASPWGLGGILLVNNVCKEFFASPLTELDEKLFLQVRGSPDGQQIWESLAALVALRLWRPAWGRHSLSLRVRGDSMTMLSLIVNLRPSTPQLGLIGREIAMEYAQAVFVPVVSEHIPGVANVTADQLSRWYMPGHSETEIDLLRDAVRQHVPSRDRSYYVTLADTFEPMKMGTEGLSESGQQG